MDTIDNVSRRRRRAWSLEAKRKMVEETLAPGASVSVIAQQHDVNANQLFAWRRLYDAGLLGVGTSLLPVQIAPAELAAPVVAEPATPVPSRSRPGMIEIELPGGRVRVRGHVDGEALRHVIDVLSGR